MAWKDLSGLQKGLLIGVPIVLVAIIVVIIIMVVISSGNGNNEGCATAINCDSASAKSEAKRFYDDEGEWAGVYTMSVDNSVSVNDNTCDVAYTYTHLTNGSSGPDYRRFTYAQDPVSCDWTSTGMGDYQSGGTAV